MMREPGLCSDFFKVSHRFLLMLCEGVEDQLFLDVPNFESWVGGIFHAEKNAVSTSAVPQEQASVSIFAVSEGSNVAGVSVFDKQASEIIRVFYSEKRAFLAICPVQTKSDATIVKNPEATTFISVRIVQEHAYTICDAMLQSPIFLVVVDSSDCESVDSVTSQKNKSGDIVLAPPALVRNWRTNKQTRMSRRILDNDSTDVQNLFV